MDGLWLSDRQLNIDFSLDIFFFFYLGPFPPDVGSCFWGTDKEGACEGVAAGHVLGGGARHALQVDD